MNQEKIGNFIRMIRIEKEMTQQELADKIGVTDRAISKWENGRGMPDITLLIPLSSCLGVTVLELLNGERGIDEENAVIELIKEKDKKTKIWRYLSIGIINIIFVIMMIILIFGFLIPMAYENSSMKGLMVVRSASMEPAIKTWDAIIYNKVDIENVEKDDIVVYNWIDENGAFLVSENGHIMVIHRVIDVLEDKDGNVSLITMGDNNVEIDNVNVTSHNFVGIYDRQTSNLTAFLLRYDLHKYPSIFIFLMISVFGILCFNIVQFRKYFLSK